MTNCNKIIEPKHVKYMVEKVKSWIQSNAVWINRIFYYQIQCIVFDSIEELHFFEVDIYPMYAIWEITIKLLLNWPFYALCSLLVSA